MVEGAAVEEFGGGVILEAWDEGSVITEGGD